MPDITLCSNEKCPRRRDCYRHEARPSPMQSSDEFKPAANGACAFFEPIIKRENKHG